MTRPQIATMTFAKVYPFYVQKAERKNRTKEEVDQIICWLTGYTQAGLQRQIKQGKDMETFFTQAPAMNPNSSLIIRCCVWRSRRRNRRSAGAENSLFGQTDR